jgi:transglutaminase-like putative cysteine protease
VSASPEAAVASPPRPLSSYGLAVVSGAALAVTGQLSPIALSVHSAALVASLYLRTAPRAWQRSAWILNGALAAVVLFAMASWLRGGLALVALAHFAYLAQALQLLDARPRRSDFLLVALSLFQMILAANLTDSLLFPPLLLAFVLAMVWTLVVHTLWSEALAAGEPWCAERALAPGLLRTTLAAAGLSLVLAFGIFLVLPRVRSGALAAPGLVAIPQAGFSDRIALGDLGRIREDPTVVMRVETIAGVAPAREDAYWRGLAFDHFDGRTWSVTPPRRVLLSRGADLGLSLSRARQPADLEQSVLREPVAAGVLFSEGVPTELEGSLGRLESDPNGGLYAPESSGERVQYQVTTASRPPAAAQLEDDRALAPGHEGARYLALPPLSDAVSALARRITEGFDGDAARVAAIEGHLRRTGRYSDRPPPEDPRDPRSPIEAFLLEETSGHCEYYATGMVVLLRSLGIPARLVNGFAGGSENAIGGFVELARSDAHAWVEVHYEKAGWVRYDPTPADARLRVADGRWLVQLRNVASALEHWWYQNVVEFDRSHQMRALRDGWLAWRRWRSESGSRSANPGAARTGRPSFDGRRLLPLGVGLVGLGAGGFLWRRRRHRDTVRTRLPGAYADALRLLRRHRGLVRGASTSARDFAREASCHVPPAAAAAFWSLTEDYLAERFGARRPPTARAALHALRDTLRRR